MTNGSTAIDSVLEFPEYAPQSAKIGFSSMVEIDNNENRRSHHVLSLEDMSQVSRLAIGSIGYRRCARERVVASGTDVLVQLLSAYPVVPALYKGPRVARTEALISMVVFMQVTSLIQWNLWEGKPPVAGGIFQLDSR